MSKPSPARKHHTGQSKTKQGASRDPFDDFVGKLGRNHFAHLRSVAEGLDVLESARRYLGVLHGTAALSQHRLTVERVRAIARRQGDSRWRLIGLNLSDAPSAEGEGSAPPSLDQWAESEGLEDWSEAELKELYVAKFGDGDPSVKRHLARNARLRAKRVALLRHLEKTAAEKAAPTDLLEGWLPPQWVQAWRQAGVLTLGELGTRINRGGRWWSVVPGFGPVKARRLAQHVRGLEADSAGDAGAENPGPRNASTTGALNGLSGGGLTEVVVIGGMVIGSDLDPKMLWPVLAAPHRLAGYSGRTGANRVVLKDGAGAAATAAQDDREAVRAWISARAGSPLTMKQYEREADRFILWCVLERRKALSDATVEDCKGYMDFLKKIPEPWISRRKADYMQPGWAPFKGQLSIASQVRAIAALHSLFSWLVQARYLAGNPWVLVNRKLGDDPRRASHSGGGLVIGDVTSRAFTPAAWKALHVYLNEAAKDATSEQEASLARLRWICTFVECTGLRASELLLATRTHLVQTTSGWMVQVHGKGRKNRSVPVPAVAIKATEEYLKGRGLALDAMAPELPLLASLTDSAQPISYRALHETFTRFVRRALTKSRLPTTERLHAQQASSHWLRHTHATRAAERNVPPDVLQENLGQADPRTTARYYRAQIERRQREIERAFG